MIRITGIIDHSVVFPKDAFSLHSHTVADPRLVGMHTMGCSLYTVPLGGRPVWFETHDVEVRHGVFTVDLGLKVSLPEERGELYWIAVSVDGAEGERHPFFPFTGHGSRRCSAIAI